MRLLSNLLLAVLSFIIILLISIYQPLYLDFENKTYDLRYGLKVSKKNFEEIVIVDIDARSLEKLGRFQNWPRSNFARIINYLDEVKALGVDIFWGESDSLSPQMKEAVGQRLDARQLPKQEIFPLLSFDQDLASAIRNNGKVIMVASYEEGRVLEPLEIFKSGARGVGLGTVVPDLDGVVRRATPVYKLSEGRSYPGFAYLIARYANSHLKIDTNRVYQIGYLGEEGSFRRISFYDVLEERIPKEFFRDKIVIIGATALGLFDNNPAPFDPIFPGVELHANLIYDYLYNYFIKGSPCYLTLLTIFILIVITVVLFAYLKPWTGGVLLVFVYIVFLIINHFFFTRNLWLEIVRPTYGIIVAVIATLGYRFLFEEKQKKIIKDMFGRYVSKDVVEFLVNNPPALGGKRVEATVLFADIRNFTTLSEKLSPEAIVKILNDYFSLVTRDIHANRGMVDKFIGDGIMAVFGVPVFYPDHALMAVKTALRMKVRIEELQEKYPIRVGIGINSGLMICGNIGSHDRMDYTVIGDSVNQAARLEALTKEFNAQIIISESTYEKVKDHIEARDLGWVRVKGKEQEIHIYEVLALKG